MFPTAAFSLAMGFCFFVTLALSRRTHVSLVVVFSCEKYGRKIKVFFFFFFRGSVCTRYSIQVCACVACVRAFVCLSLVCVCSTLAEQGTARGADACTAVGLSVGIDGHHYRFRAVVLWEGRYLCPVCKR